MSLAEVPFNRETTLAQIRQPLLGLAFACAEYLISVSPGQEFRVGNRGYYLEYSLKPLFALSNPEVDHDEIRGNIILPRGSKRYALWSEAIPAKPPIDGSDLFVFFLRKELNFQKEEFGELFDGSRLDERGQYRTISWAALTMLTHDFMDIISRLPSKN